jgi:uncharacterized protein YlaN (UPF0358 family)
MPLKKTSQTESDLTKILRECEPPIKRYTVIYDNKTKTYCVMDSALHDTVIEGSKKEIEFFLKGIVVGRTTHG